MLLVQVLLLRLVVRRLVLAQRVEPRRDGVDAVGGVVGPSARGTRRHDKRERHEPVKGTGQDQVVVGGQLVETFAKGPVVYQTAGLVDDDEREDAPK